MRTSRRLFGLLSVLLVSFCLSACSFNEKVVSFAGFERFEFHQHPGLGFCPDESCPAEVTIVRQSDGSGSAEVIDLAWRADSDSCVSRVVQDSCLVLVPLAAKTLSPEVMSELDTLFSAVRVRDSSGIVGKIIDPCAIVELCWDGYCFGNIEEWGPSMKYEERRRLLDELTEHLGTRKEGS